MSAVQGLGLLLIMTLVACTARESQRRPETFLMFSTENIYSSQKPPQCKSLLDNYCNFLYSPTALGNIEIKRQDETINVLQGETNNQFSQVFYRYSQAKIRNQEILPKDFARLLVDQNYFDKLKVFLERVPRGRMTLFDRLYFERMDYELDFIWSAAFNETVITRMNRKFPDFHRIPDKLVPVELDLERRRIRRTLVSEISQALWHNDKNWHKVELGFSRLKTSFLKVIARLDIPDSVRKDWSTRISEVKLVLPGSVPGISDEECSTTQANAYYYRYLNLLTVCAGDFNSEDSIQTLAHEMAHALGIDRGEYLYQVNSLFGKKLGGLRSQVCAPKTFSCTAWEEYKNNFSQSLSSLEGYRPTLPEFNRCLKRRVSSKPLNQDDLERVSRIIVADRVSDLASNDRFLRITKAEIPLRNGKLQKNPNYLNPCGYYLWSQGEEPIDDELTTMIYFTAEYRCSSAESSHRLKEAIEVAKAMSQEVLEHTIAMEGEFSPRSLLESEGFSSPPFERFADVVGSYAMAEYLTGIEDPWDRQNRYLASSSWQCAEPSLDSHYPEESSVEKEYIFDAHAEREQRKKELLSLPIRRAIGCEKDFEFKECSLPFKSR